jgi:uncharacterized membrane protein
VARVTAPLSATSTRGSLEFDRVMNFTDAVFAIALTLLVLSLDVPPGRPDSEVAGILRDVAPKVFTLLLSFVIIAVFWRFHHRLVATLTGISARWVWANMAFILTIVLVPFSSELIGEYGDTSIAVVVYAANMTAVSWTLMLLDRVALRDGHVEPSSRTSIRAGALSSLFVGAVFAASIPVAFASTLVAELSWILCWPAGAAADRIVASRSAA